MMHFFESVTMTTLDAFLRVAYVAALIAFMIGAASVLVYALGPVLGFFLTILFFQYIRR